MKVTRKTIAQAAGVSLSTVHMILSGQGERYHEDTRKRVLKVAADLGYQPSINARAFSLNRSLLLGVLINAVNTHIAAQFLLGVQGALAATDYSPLVFFSKDEADQDFCLTRCLNRHVDGLLVNCTVDAATAKPDDFAHRLAASAKPVIEVFGHFLPGTPKVNIDNATSGFLCTRQLIDQGHRRIGLLTHSRYDEPTLHFDAWEQSCGYRRALAAAGLDPIILKADVDFANPSEADFLRAGFDAHEALLALPQPPTAVLCYSDFMAIGLDRAYRFKSLISPGSLSITGIDGSIFPLSSAISPFYEIGHTAATHLLQAISGQSPADTLIAASINPVVAQSPNDSAMATTPIR